MKLKIISVLALSAFAVSAAAQDEGFKISGDFASSIFVESGKGANSTFPLTGAVNTNPAAATLAGENSGDFSVDQVEINLEKTVGNSGIVLGLGFGRMFDLINNSVSTGAAAPKSTLNITNAYFHHKVGDSGLTFKLGKFSVQPTNESYRYMDNVNYTRSGAFTYMNPWFLTGAAADYAVNDMITVGAVVANTTYNLDADENESKHWGVNATIKPMEGLNLKLNYLSGKEGTIPAAAAIGFGGVGYTEADRINATVGYTFGSMYDVAVHYSSLNQDPVNPGPGVTDATATSIALYAGAKMETWGAGLRYEMLNDDDGLLFGPLDNQVDTITVTGWYNLDQNLSVKAEVVSMSSDVAVFQDDEFAADDAAMSYGLGFLYRF